MLTTAAMYDILEAFGSPGRPTRDEIATQVERDVTALRQAQNDDGGWGYFHGMSSDPFVTMQVLHALAARSVGGAITQNASAYVAKQATALLDRIANAAALPIARRAEAFASSKSRDLRD